MSNIGLPLRHLEVLCERVRAIVQQAEVQQVHGAPMVENDLRRQKGLPGAQQHSRHVATARAGTDTPG